jgi:adenosine 3'-phospho 5'-phosphosulfate transporter B2
MKWKSESFRNVAPLEKYFFISISNSIATFCQYESLRYISFPTQTVGKCGKMLPIMILR